MLLSANVVICESVLIEKSGIASAVRILNALTIPLDQNITTFKVHTMLSSTPMDFQRHVARVWMHPMKSDAVVASAPDHPFVFGNTVDYSGPGAFNLTTDFTLDLRPLGAMGHYMISVSVDDERVAQTPIMLRRG